MWPLPSGVVFFVLGSVEQDVSVWYVFLLVFNRVESVVVPSVVSETWNWGGRSAGAVGLYGCPVWAQRYVVRVGGLGFDGEAAATSVWLHRTALLLWLALCRTWSVGVPVRRHRGM